LQSFVTLLAYFRSVPDAYAEKLIEEKVLTQQEVNWIVQKHTDYLTEELKNFGSYQEEVLFLNKKNEDFQYLKKIHRNHISNINGPVFSRLQITLQCGTQD
jgi:2-oxoglutarate dehydrogenase complex dehydrogenase (E1) component-like enzyme